MIMVLAMMRIIKSYPCKCGTEKCIGYIVREGSRWRLAKKK